MHRCKASKTILSLMTTRRWPVTPFLYETKKNNPNAKNLLLLFKRDLKIHVKPAESLYSDTCNNDDSTKGSSHTHTHTRLMTLCPGLPRWAGTRKVKPIWILLKQETVSGSGISWAICNCTSLQTDNHASTSLSLLKFFTGRMPFLPPNQQRQSAEGRKR